MEARNGTSKEKMGPGEHPLFKGSELDSLFASLTTIPANKELAKQLSALSEKLQALQENAEKKDLEIQALQKNALEKDKEIKELQAQALSMKDRLEKPLNIPLFDYAKNGDDNRIAHLVNCGADIHAQDENGFTALQLAVLGNHMQTAIFLAGKGAEWDALDAKGNTILHILCATGKTERLPEVLAEYPKLTIHPVLQQIYELAPDESVKKIIANFMLFIAVKQSNLDHVAEALQKNANINAQNDYQESALHKAVYLKLPDIVHFLLENNADTELQDRGQQTPIQVTSDPAMKLLISTYRLLRAVNSQDIKLIDTLLQQNMDVNEAKNKQGMTPLHFAVLQGNVDIIAKLLLAGANPMIPNEAGKTALHLAAATNNKVIANLLLKANIKFDKVAVALVAQDAPSAELNGYIMYRLGRETGLRKEKMTSLKDSDFSLFSKTRIAKAAMKHSDHPAEISEQRFKNK